MIRTLYNLFFFSVSSYIFEMSWLTNLLAFGFKTFTSKNAIWHLNEEFHQFLVVSEAQQGYLLLTVWQWYFGFACDVSKYNLSRSFSKTYTLCLLLLKKLRCQHPNLGGKDSSFLKMPEKLITSDVAYINSVLIIPSSSLSWLLIFRIVRIKYVGLCLNPVIKHEHTVCDS